MPGDLGGGGARVMSLEAATLFVSITEDTNEAVSESLPDPRMEHGEDRSGEAMGESMRGGLVSFDSTWSYECAHETAASVTTWSCSAPRVR